MPDIEPHEVKGVATDQIVRHESHIEKIGGVVVTVLGILSMFFWWPKVADWSRWAFITCFPVLFPICPALASAKPVGRKLRTRGVILSVIVVHCALLAGFVALWRTFPGSVSIRNPLAVFGFMGVELVFISALFRLNAPNNPRPSSKSESE